MGSFYLASLLGLEGFLRVVSVAGLSLGLVGCSSDDELGEATEESPSPSNQAELDPKEATYCDLEMVLFQKCVRCHDDPGAHGAPMSFATYDEVRVRRDTIEWVVDNDIMPPVEMEVEPAVESLSEDEKDALLGWLQNGAPNCP